MPDPEFSPNTSSFCSSHGSSTITYNSSERSTTSTDDHHHHHPQYHLSPPLKLQADSAESKLASPLNVNYYTESKLLYSPSPGHRRNPAESVPNDAMKKSKSLMKLRRQGSHLPGINGTIMHQSAAARELMASLERLSLSEKGTMPTMKNGTENQGEARRSLLRAETEEGIGVRVPKGGGQGLPLCAVIAAAMDADGEMGVKKEIAERVEQMMRERELQVITPVDQMEGVRMMKKQKKTKTKTTTKKKKQRRAAGYVRWVVRPKLRPTRTVLEKVWRNIKRLFSSSIKSRRAKKELLSTKD